MSGFKWSALCGHCRGYPDQKQCPGCEKRAEALAEALEQILARWEEGHTEQDPGAFLNARDVLARHRGEKPSSIRTLVEGRDE